MGNSMTETLQFPRAVCSDVLTEVLRVGAQRLLAEAVQMEAAQWIAARADQVDEDGHRQVVRNGYSPQRQVLTGLGPVGVRQPRIADRRPSLQREKFDRKILPPYLRRTPSLDEAIPWMYLYGISTNDMTESLEALLGPAAKGVPPTTVSRRVEIWKQEYAGWNQRSLADQQYVYLWADGVYFNIRMEEDKACIRVLLGATAVGRKAIIAIADGYRESEPSWSAVLLDLKSRGLTFPPKLATGDGPWVLGRPWRRSIRKRVSNAAGCTRRATCRANCPNACTTKPAINCGRLGWPTRSSTPRKRLICSWQPTRINIWRRGNACKKTARSC